MAQRRPALPQPTRGARVRRVRTPAVIGCIAIAVIAAGCGGGHNAATSTAGSTIVRADPQKRLTAAVRETLLANHRLAKLVLWRDSVPAPATSSTRGPALAALRSAAAGRRRQGIHVKVVSDSFRIASVALDPSFTSATAVVVDPQRVRPYGSDGKPLGKPVSLSEKSRFVLHRIGASERFVVVAGRSGPMMTKALIACIAVLLVMSSRTALADGPIKIGINSQQYGPGRAHVSAHINASATRPGETRETQAVVVTVKTRGGAASNLPTPFPALSKSSRILKDQHPGGPGSFWYTDSAGHACQYVPNSVAPCFTLVGPGSNGADQLSPFAVAQSLARRVELAPGEIKTSPTRQGLTGAQSWFWLDPAPTRQSLSISLAGETVNVTADPTVEWRFGDGASLDGGPGVPYQADAASSAAITHVYDTRCLPRDQGHDPYALASCGPDGYSVEALVVWRISYSAAGPVAASGALSARTTETSASYPVSESRAFLVSGGGQ